MVENIHLDLPAALVGASEEETCGGEPVSGIERKEGAGDDALGGQGNSFDKRQLGSGRGGGFWTRDLGAAVVFGLDGGEDDAETAAQQGDGDIGKALSLTRALSPGRECLECLGEGDGGVGEDGEGLGEVVSGEGVKVGVAAESARREEGIVVIHRIRGIKKLLLIV